MKKALLLFCAPLMVLSCTEHKAETAAAASAKDTSVTEAPHVKPDSATAMKNWEAYATPGDMQKLMSSWDGEWTGECSMWMSPDTPPVKSQTTAVYKTILGGRYSESIHTGNMMGMAFEGKGLTAYDNARKVFQSTWIDNMGTGIMILEGKWDEPSHSLTLSGKMVMGDMGDGSQTDVKEVIRFDDPDHQVMEMYYFDNGKEVKSMEIRSERKNH
ncbi:MAG: DUF1579 domain-containing protein [Chitinophagaceae bacterium]